MSLETQSNLRAECLTDGWSVVDSDGGRWWPNNEAQEEIAASANPEAAAVWMCQEAPMRGTWHA